ncbi:cyclin-U1-1 [Physcomitrium patens]|nr:cyclin-U1-1-like [Physcomitrium patens]|eukprot:XP_024358568.1 cyclin-U1-1-like [Physcomitrella patens]
MLLAHKSGMMPPACRTPGFLGENGRGGEHEVSDVDALRMQLAVSSVKSSSQVASSKGSSSLTFEAPDIDDDAGSSDKEIPKVLYVLAAVLDRLVARNEQFSNAPSQQGKKLTIFHGLRAPNISIANYLERIFKYTSCSPSCFVVGYVFLDRLIHRQPDLLVTSLNVHRLLVTSVMVATKMLDDVHFNNAFFARVGGVSVLELNRLELEFLFRLDFKLSVTISVFESYCTFLERDISALEKRPERIERSLPAFASAPVSAHVSAPGTPRGSAPPTPKETSPRSKKRIPPGLPVSYAGRKQTALHYQQQPVPHYFVRDSSPSR